MKKLNIFIFLFSITGYFYAQTARVQVIHNSADLAAKEVDVYLNDALLLDDFKFRTATPFIDAPANEEIVISVAPQDSNGVEDSIYSAALTLAENETYVVVADGIVSSAGYNPIQPFGLQVYPMGREVATDSNNTDLLVHHGSTDAPTVDVVEVGVGAGKIIDDLFYTEFRGYLELPTDDYSLEIRDKTDSFTVAAFDAPLSTLGLNGAALVVVASGFLDPSQNSNRPSFGLYVALPSGGDLVMLPNIPTGTARVQVIHNSADAAAELVDVYLDDTLLIPNFAFRTASPFIDAPSGIEIQLSVAPPNSNGVEDAIYSATVTLSADETYVVVADGIVSGTGYTPSQPFGLQIYPMGRELATDSNNTDVLVHHGSTDAPTVDVVEVGVGAGTIVDDLAYTDFQGYLELPTDDYTLEIRDESGTVTVAAYEAPLAALGLDGAALAVIASGFLDPSQNSDGPAFGLFVALPSGGDLIALPSAPIVQTARVQVIHNSADAAAEFVDVYLNEDLLIPDFQFRTASPFIDAPAGEEINLSVAPAGSVGVEDAIYTAAVTLTQNETYVLVADGIVSDSGYNPSQPFGLQIYPMGRELASDANNTDVLVHHGSTDAPTVDVVEVGVGAGTIVDDLAYTDFQGYLELPTDDYTLEIRDETGTVTVAAYEAPLSTLGLGGVALTVIASGFLDPSQNSDGPAFGLYVALIEGGNLIPLPVATLGLGEFDQNSLVMYPNPVVNSLNIDFLDIPQEILEINITDMQGRKVSNMQINQGQGNKSIDVSSLATGVYQVNILQGNNLLDSKKLIKN
jgi:hypothetical protein